MNYAIAENKPSALLPRPFLMPVPHPQIALVAPKQTRHVAPAPVELRVGAARKSRGATDCMAGQIARSVV